MSVVFACDGVEMKEVGGMEGASTITKNGRMVIQADGNHKLVSIDIDGNKLPIITTAQKPIQITPGSREFIFATEDIMAWVYVTLAKDTPEPVLAYLAVLLEAASKGEKLPVMPGIEPVAQPLAAAAPPAPAADAAPSSEAPAPGGPPAWQQQLAAIAAKAMHDTQQVAAAIRAKAEHDIQELQKGQPQQPSRASPS